MSRSDDSQTVRPAVLDGPGPRAAHAAGCGDAWIARLREGDPAALDRLARSEAPRVARLLVRMLGPRADLEDLVQTVFLEACRALPRFRGEGAVSTFIGGITVRVARRAMRPSAWLKRRVHVELDPVADGDPEHAAQQAEQLHHLNRALSKISPKKRIAFVLWAVEGMDVAEIAQLTSASASATKSRIFYAQKELKRMAAHDPRLRELLQGGDHGAR
jgi:RNA polymerase sigma-70 factor (ECF subfamily)